MSEAVRKAGQGRDGAVQAATASPGIDPNGRQPWQPRRDDKRAVLVSERSAVFDRRRADLAPADPVEEIRDPLWDHAQGTRWTPDLVHCRLVVVGEITLRMPGHLRRSFVSVIGNMAVSEAGGGGRAAPSPAEITLADWTWDALFALPRDRFRLLQSRAFGISYAKIAASMQRHGIKDASPQSVRKWDIAERRALAGTWQGLKQPVDGATFDRWRTIFERRQK